MTWRVALPALAAAVLFGASTPLAKALVGEVPPLLLAGLLYLGSGLGLSLLMLLRHGRRVGSGRSERSDRAGHPGPSEHAGHADAVVHTEHTRHTERTERTERTDPANSLGLAGGAADPSWWAIPRGDWPWLLGAIFFGGMLGPALLMHGLAHASAASAALLLNLEGVFTALLAWLVFKENADRRIVLGMLAIVAGGVLLSWAPGALSGTALSPGTAAIVAACLCWAIDNNLTRKVSTHDAMLLAALKGLIAGACNTALALAAGAALPAAPALAASLALGLVAYGLSLMLFVVGLRTLGAARTGAYFSVAPLVGVAVALLIWPEWPGARFWAAAALMASGVWLHLQERHEHEHQHEPLEHTHRHRHDDGHHDHPHDFPWQGEVPHTHTHRHEAQTHTHAHVPDVHHRHGH